MSTDTFQYEKHVFRGAVSTFPLEKRRKNSTLFAKLQTVKLTKNNTKNNAIMTGQLRKEDKEGLYIIKILSGHDSLPRPWRRISGEELSVRSTMVDGSVEPSPPSMSSAAVSA